MKLNAMETDNVLQCLKIVASAVDDLRLDNLQSSKFRQLAATLYLEEVIDTPDYDSLLRAFQ